MQIYFSKFKFNLYMVCNYPPKIKAYWILHTAFPHMIVVEDQLIDKLVLEAGVE